MILLNIFVTVTLIFGDNEQFIETLSFVKNTI